MLFRCGTYLRSLHCKYRHSLVRCFCSNRKDSKPLTLKQKRDLVAQEWFKHLNHKMKMKKKWMENLIDDIKEQKNLTNLEVSPGDLKILLTEHHHIANLKNFLGELHHIEKKRRARQEEEMKEQARDEELARMPDAINKYGVYKYVVDSNEQNIRFNKHRASLALRNSSPIVFDLGYPILDKSRETRAMWVINNASRANLYYPEPCSIHVTSFLKNSFLKENFDLKAFWPERDYMNFRTESFETLFPREKLLYLSPDGPPLQEHTPGDVYVIGGLVNATDNQPHSLRRAEKLDIRCYSLPLVSYGFPLLRGRKGFGYCLQMDTVFELIVNLNLTQNLDFVMQDFKKSLETDRFTKYHRTKMIGFL